MNEREMEHQLFESGEPTDGSIERRLYEAALDIELHKAVYRMYKVRMVPGIKGYNLVKDAHVMIEMALDMVCLEYNLSTKYRDEILQEARQILDRDLMGES